MQEMLVLTERADDTLRKEIGTRLHVLQEVYPRIVVVEGEQATIDTIASHPDVQKVESVDLDNAGLNYAESLAVRAWAANRSDKARPHEGLNWGAKGFQGP